MNIVSAKVELEEVSVFDDRCVGAEFAFPWFVKFQGNSFVAWTVQDLAEVAQFPLGAKPGLGSIFGPLGRFRLPGALPPPPGPPAGFPMELLPESSSVKS